MWHVRGDTYGMPLLRRERAEGLTVTPLTYPMNHYAKHSNI